VGEVQEGKVHVTAVPLVEEEIRLGFVVLVHDMSFVSRRDAAMQRFLFFAFGILAIAASAMTFIAGRLSSRRFMDEFKRFVRGDFTRPEFQPLLHDVRELVERLSGERDAELQGGVWTPQRLKRTLSQHLEGEKVVIVANREPYIHEKTADGQIAVLHPASGLVTAL
jgi:trehalose 6-phosphate synthase